MCRAVAAMVVLLSAPIGVARAQTLGAVSDALGRLDDEAPLVLAEPAPLVVRVAGDFDAFAAPLVRSLSRRLDVEVVLGAEPPGGLCAAVEPGQACVAPVQDHDLTSALVLFLSEDGRFYETEVMLEEERGPAVRALAIAVVDVREAARSATPLPTPAVGERAPERHGSSWVYVEREGGLFGRRRSIESLARPTIYFRALVGLTSGRSTVLFGPGIGLGLCVGDFCAVLEGDVPVFEEQHSYDAPRSLPDDTISFRPIFVAARLGYRPLRAGPVTGGITWGLLDRFGNAWMSSTGENQLVNDLGMRQSIEVSIEISRPFEWVVEAGLDVSFAPARWVTAARTGNELQFLTDPFTGWGVTALRVRP